MRVFLMALLITAATQARAGEGSKYVEVCADFGDGGCVIYGYDYYGYSMMGTPEVAKKINSIDGRNLIIPLSDSSIAALRQTGMSTITTRAEEVAEKPISDLEEGFSEAKTSCIKDEVNCGISIVTAIKDRGLNTLAALAACTSMVESCVKVLVKYHALVQRLDALEAKQKSEQVAAPIAAPHPSDGGASGVPNAPFWGPTIGTNGSGMEPEREGTVTIVDPPGGLNQFPTDEP